MKNVYLLSGALFTVFALNAQQLVPYKKFASRKDAGLHLNYPKAPMQTRAAGDVIYSSDFSASNAWTFTDNSSPAMLASSLTIGTTGPTGAYSSGLGAIASTSAANGFALIDSDAGYSANGAQDVKLTFNQTMDFTNFAAVTLEFQSFYRVFYDSVYIEFNVDNAGWTDFQIRLDEELGNSDMSANPKQHVINVSNIVGGHSNVQFRFRYRGQWGYAWMVDDVRFVESWDNDMVMSQVYMATPGGGEDYYKVPASQADFPGLTFGAYVSNQGALAQNNTKLSVTQNGGTPVLGNAFSVGVLAEDSITMETPLMLASGTNTFALTTDLGVPDQSNANNQDSRSVFFGGTEYSRHNGTAASSFNYVSIQDGFKCGNLMYINNDMTLAYVVAKVTASGNISSDLFAEIQVYDQANDTWTQIGYKDLSVSVNNTSMDAVFDFSSDQITLTAGSYIRVWAGNNTSAPDEPVRFQSAQKTGPQMSYIGFLNDAGTDYDIFWTDNAPMISIFEGVASVKENNAEFSVNVFPNPAVNEAKVSFELKNTADVLVTVTDLSGKVVYTANLANTAAGKHNVEINTVELASGMYTVNFNANGAVVTEKLVIRK